MKLFPLTALILMSCAPMTEDEKFDIWYETQMEYEKYLERKQACMRAGMIWVTQFEEKRGKVPHRHEMRTAYCTTRLF